MNFITCLEDQYFIYFFLRNLSHIFIVSYTSWWQFAILCLLDYFILCISVQKSSVWGCAENYFRRCCCLHKSLLNDFPWKRIWLFFFSKYFSQQFPLRSTTCGRFPHYEPNTSVQTGSLYATHLTIFYTADWHTSWIQIKIESLILSYYPTVPLVNLHITWAWHFTILHILYGWKKSQSIIHMYYTVYVFTNSAALLVAACSTSSRIFPEQVQSTFLKGKSRTTERRRNPSVNIRSMQG